MLLWIGLLILLVVLTLLLQTIGVVPSIRTRWMNKSTQVAYILRVSGYEQLIALKDVFGDKHRADK